MSGARGFMDGFPSRRRRSEGAVWLKARSLVAGVDGGAVRCLGDDPASGSRAVNA